MCTCDIWHGGLTPFAINASSFRVQTAAEANAQTDDDDDDEALVAGARTKNATKVVPAASAEAYVAPEQCSERSEHVPNALNVPNNIQFRTF